MDIFYNHLSAFSADSTPHSGDLGNTKEMAKLLSSQETSVKWNEEYSTKQHMQGCLSVKVQRMGE